MKDARIRVLIDSDMRQALYVLSAEPGRYVRIAIDRDTVVFMRGNHDQEPGAEDYGAHPKTAAGLYEAIRDALQFVGRCRHDEDADGGCLECGREAAARLYAPSSCHEVR